MLEGMPDRIDSKFRFVLLAAQRAEQMMRGAQPKVEPGGRKVSRVAVEEIMTDRVSWDYGPAQVEEPPAIEDELAPVEGAQE